jgi:hypothetical protein
MKVTEPEPEPYSTLPEGLRKILNQVDRDREAGDFITDSRWPGAWFSPQAAAELAALEIESEQGDE